MPASVVFQKPRQRVDLRDCYQWWTYIPGANWRHPEGPASSLKGKAKHPVVQLAYEDVEAYAKWIGKELPTEAEWEAAAEVRVYEEGSQIRRSAKSIRSNIVEGYGRRRYKQEFIRFLTYAHASCDETIDHLETLIETGSLKDDAIFKKLHDQLDQLGANLNLFIRSVEWQHLSVREEGVEYFKGDERK